MDQATHPIVTGAALVSRGLLDVFAVNLSEDVFASLSVETVLLRNMTTGQAVATEHLAMFLDPAIVLRNGTVGGWTGSQYTGITALISAGYNGGGWDGSGIVTSESNALTGLTTLAPVSAAHVLGLEQGQTGLWHGETVSADDVLIKYTYGGDSNFDGKLDADDYGTIDFNVLLPGVVDGYYNGDFNFDGKVDADDYGVIDFNILAQNGPL